MGLTQISSRHYVYLYIKITVLCYAVSTFTPPRLQPRVSSRSGSLSWILPCTMQSLAESRSFTSNRNWAVPKQASGIMPFFFALCFPFLHLIGLHCFAVHWMMMYDVFSCTIARARRPGSVASVSHQLQTLSLLSPRLFKLTYSSFVIFPSFPMLPLPAILCSS